MSLKKIVVIGSTNTDMVVRSKRLPVPGETILGGSFMMNQGGKGANQAVAVARLNGDITFIAKTGDDVFGQKMVEVFRTENINTDYVFTETSSPTGVAIIMVDAGGENSIVVASGANSTLNTEDINKAKDVIESAEILLMQLEIPLKTVEYAARMASEMGVKVILNPAPASFLSDNLMGCLYAIIPNESEAEILSGIKVTDWASAKLASDVISSKGVGIVVITLGSKGAFIKENENYYEIPVKKIKAVDTTAAGDTFCGAFCVGLSEGLSIKDAAIMANKAAGITVTREGAQAAIPYRSEINC